MAADSPDAYDGQKESGFPKAVTASWVESSALNGVPPKLGSGACEAEISPMGLGRRHSRRIRWWRSAGVNARTVLKLKLTPAGGDAIRLVPVR